MKRLLILLCLAAFLFVACSEKAQPPPKQLTADEEAKAAEMIKDKDNYQD